ncbi:hypothetical protein [Jannaschia sp. W003]|uniref:hypothetical protein n=1 Tax=Jannaschia sp. W003 TaxID=2867012 RepID=UPI0021A27C60|nr:hypothetical protein [Jannaschia sp. W003]UWQ21675.1 hypothetical protein K3554_01195 [Jannaschia sp. W003]
MRPDLLLAAAAALLLAGCNTPLGTEVARTAAKSAVNAEVQRRFPGAPVQPVTDCVIDNATGAEIIEVAAGAASGTDARTAEIVGTVLARPDTIRCVLAEGLPTLVGSL